MYALSKAANIRKNSDGEYAILGIPYAQYLKGSLILLRISELIIVTLLRFMPVWE